MGSRGCVGPQGSSQPRRRLGRPLRPRLADLVGDAPALPRRPGAVTEASSGGVPVGASLAARLAAAVDAGMPRARDDLARLVALRSVANPAIEPESECRAAAALVGDLLAE